MKFSYSQRLGKYVASELGTIVDSDDEFDALLTRHGILEEDEPEETAIDTNDAIADNATDDDDLALINDLLFNDDHDTATNYQSTGIGA